MFRAFGHQNSSVLDGGLPRWEAEGLEIETVSPKSQSSPIDYPEPKLDANVVRSEWGDTRLWGSLMTYSRL
jgi:thiosulfate/3-mercaptopyruvate sulfurtransferase